MGSKQNREKIKEWTAQYPYTPYLTHASRLRQIDTDIDHFPYKRFYRGVATCQEPRVFDREAGYKPWNNNGYTPTIVSIPPPPTDGCFQIACSTILPCINTDTLYKKPLDVCVNISP